MKRFEMRIQFKYLFKNMSISKYSSAQHSHVQTPKDIRPASAAGFHRVRHVAPKFCAQGR